MNSWKRRWRIAVAGIGAAMAFAAACGSPDRGMKSQESAASGAVNEESADKSVASDAEPRPGLLENASPDTSALTLFYYDGETVTQRILFDSEKEKEILQKINELPYEAADISQL